MSARDAYLWMVGELEKFERRTERVHVYALDAVRKRAAMIFTYGPDVASRLKAGKCPLCGQGPAEEGYLVCSECVTAGSMGTQVNRALQFTPPRPSEVSIPYTLKSLREHLCVAQTALGEYRQLPHVVDVAQREAAIMCLTRLIEDIDRQCPLDSAGLHDCHTPTCGCVDRGDHT